MATVYKCDRCKKYYDDNTKYINFRIYFFNKFGRASVLDLCKDCQQELNTWIGPDLDENEL